MSSVEVGRFERKLQQQRESFYISLPISWIKANHLEKYEEVKVELMSDGSLRISSGKDGEGEND